MSLLGFLKAVASPSRVTRIEPYVGSRSTTFTAYCGDEECGEILVDLVPEQNALNVATIVVHPKFQRQGVATILYEAAAKKACEDGLRLMSTSRMPGAHSNDFWRKQVAKGRAEEVRDLRQRPVYLLNHCETSLAGLLRR